MGVTHYPLNLITRVRTFLSFFRKSDCLVQDCIIPYIYICVNIAQSNIVGRLHTELIKREVTTMYRVLALFLAVLIIQPSEGRAEFTKHKIAKIINLMRLKTATPEGRVHMSLYTADEQLVHVSYQVLAGTNAQPAFMIAFHEIERSHIRGPDTVPKTVAHETSEDPVPNILIDFDADGVLDYVIQEASELNDMIDKEGEQTNYLDLIKEILAALEKGTQKS